MPFQLQQRVLLEAPIIRSVVFGEISGSTHLEKLSSRLEVWGLRLNYNGMGFRIEGFGIPGGTGRLRATCHGA